jgi:hypothetical protein
MKGQGQSTLFSRQHNMIRPKTIPGKAPAGLRKTLKKMTGGIKI